MKGVHQILLCGFMGCGKTSVGQALSFRLRWEFLDTDAMIEKREGKSIPQIFSQQGEPAFRQMEQQVARGLGRRKNAVISTGGGFLMREETVRALRESAEGRQWCFWTVRLKLAMSASVQATVRWCAPTPESSCMKSSSIASSAIGRWQTWSFRMSSWSARQ